MEQRKNRLILVVTTVICFLTSFLYEYLLENIGISFMDFRGTHGRGMLISWQWGIISCVLNIILNLGLSSKVCKEQGAKYLIRLGKWIMPITNILFCSIVIYCDLNSIEVSIDKVICVFIGALLIVSGNYFPKNHINPYIGMKFPWLFSDEESWNKTHRLAAYTWIFAGALMCLYPFVNHKNIVIPLVVILVGVVPLVYSLILVLKKKARK